uniref:Uncharacterized protein n=1 Tax=Arundo donax TaxID=35708 RepID=A0A0A8Y1N0_ARUDO
MCDGFLHLTETTSLITLPPSLPQLVPSQGLTIIKYPHKDFYSVRQLVLP